jgi:hypothetical protein
MTENVHYVNIGLAADLLKFKNFDNRNPAAPTWGVKNRTREVALGDEVYSILRKTKATRIRPGKGKVSPLLYLRCALVFLPIVLTL